MPVDDEKVKALLDDGDRCYHAGNYRFAGVSYHEAKKLAPTNPEVLARNGLAFWRQAPSYFEELMANEGIAPPADGYQSLFSTAEDTAAEARSNALEALANSKEATRYAASSELLTISKYRLALVRAKGQAELAAEDLLGGRSSSLSTDVEQALQ